MIKAYLHILKKNLVALILLTCSSGLYGQGISQLLPTDTIWVIQNVQMDTINKIDYFTGYSYKQGVGLYCYYEHNKNIEFIKKTEKLFKIGKKNDSLFYFFYFRNNQINKNYDIIELNIYQGTFSIKKNITEKEIYESYSRNIYYYNDYILWIDIHEKRSQLDLYYKNEKPDTIKIDKRLIAVDFDTLNGKVNVLVQDSLKLFLYNISFKSKDVSCLELFIKELPYVHNDSIFEETGNILKILNSDLIVFGYSINKNQSKLYLYSIEKGKIIKSTTINARICDIYFINSYKMIISLMYETNEEIPFIEDANCIITTNTYVNLFEIDFSKCADGYIFTPPK
jgi:hypothetical protein